jgi:Bacterial DNA-binding protein
MSQRKSLCQKMLDDLITMITKHLKKGEKVKITGLGILQVRIFQYDATMLHNRRGAWKLAVHTLRADRRRRIGQCRVRSNIS